MYVTTNEDEVVGIIAGHLTRRFGCDGELEWIDVGLPYTYFQSIPPPRIIQLYLFQV